MKLIKVVIDGEEYYKEIKDEESKSSRKGKEENAECQSEPEASGKGKFKRDTQEFFEKVGTGAKDLGIKIVDGAKVIGGKISVGAKDLGMKIKEGTERLFNKDKSLDPESTEAKLLSLLPYMSKGDAHEVAEKLLSDEDFLQRVNAAAIMPFLSGSDCDAIFKRCIEINSTKTDLAAASRYVSKRCLSKVVDNYINGLYPNLEIDSLYPFLSDKDIRRIFYHIIEEK